MRRPLGVPTSKTAAPPPPPATAANPPSSTKRGPRQVAAAASVPPAAPQPSSETSGRGLPSVGAQAGAPRPVARCVLAPFGSHALGGSHPFEAPQPAAPFAQPEEAAVATSSAPRHAKLGSAPRPPVGGRPVASPLSDGAWPPGQPLERSSLSGVSDLYDADAAIGAPPMPGQRANTSGASDLYDPTIAERAALSVLDDFDFGEGLDLGGGGLPPLPAPAAAASASSSAMASFFGDLDSPADASALEGRSARETRALLDEKIALQQRMEELEMKLRS